MSDGGITVTYDELITLAHQYEATGNLEGLQQAHHLLLEHDWTAFSEMQRDRLWGHIFNLREDMLELQGLPPITLSDEDLAEFRTVDANQSDSDDEV